MANRKNQGNSRNTDNESTMYIPPEAARQGQQYQSAPQPQQPYQGQQYQSAPQQPYQGQQYQRAPQQPYQGQPYQSAPQQPYQGQQYQSAPQQPYQGQPYQSAPQQPYQGQQYQGAPQQPYQGQPYQGAPQQPYQEQPYQSAPQQPYQGQPYQSAPQQPYQGQPYQGVPQQPYPGQPYQGQRQSQHGQQQKKKSSKPSSPAKRPRQKKKHSGGIFSRLIGRIIFILLTILVVIFALYSVIALGLIKKIKYEDEGERYRTTGALSAPYVTSVLLVGTDGRSLDERGRSDTMILFSMNSHTKEITLTSFMRDCYVNIPGYGWDKLNASYSYGGAGLLMDTIEQNFHVAIDDYVSVNFISFAGIVDAVGGIDIDVSDAEAGEINTILQAEVNEIMGDDKLSDLLTSGGKLHLNGKQALSYARIRYIGNADFERTGRQREVITTVLNKMKKGNPTTISNIMNDVMPQVRSNMTTGQMYMLSLRLPFVFGYDIGQLQIPAEDTYWEEYTDSGSSLGVDFDQNYKIIDEKVFAER